MNKNGLWAVTGKFTDFPVCVIRSIFIRRLSHLTISSPFKETFSAPLCPYSNIAIIAIIANIAYCKYCILQIL